MKTRVFAIAHKEALHILRDWRTMAMSFALPLVMVILFGYAITFDIREITLAIRDADNSPASRALVERFVSSGYFTKVGTASSEAALGRYLDEGRAKIALSIPEDYSRLLARGEPPSVAVLVDGSESNTANIAAGYVDMILTQQTLDASLQALSAWGVGQTVAMPPVELRPRFWYNPELRSQNYIIPGLIATIMMVMTALLTSLTVVRERERGSLEQLISTPVRPWEVLIGKLIPYFVIGVIDSIMIACVGVFVMGVPFVGSVLLFLLGTAVFALAGLGIGLQISTAAKNQVVAMQMAILSSMLPSFLLSGFMFAIKSMPGWVQVITYLVPARYFLVILRGIFLKDADLLMLAPQMAFLVALATIMLTASLKRFKKKIG